jgi:hypothetical protein
MRGLSMKENQEKTIKFNFTDMKWEGLTVEQIQLWEHLYPDVDVVKVLKVDMIRWFDLKATFGNVHKVARKKNFKAFICNWLKREQLKGVGIL